MKLLRFKSRWLPALINVIGLGIAFTVFLILMSQVWWDFRYDRFKGNKDIYVLEQPYPVQEGMYYSSTIRPVLKAVADCSPDIIQYCDYTSLEDESGRAIQFKDQEGEEVRARGIRYATTETSVIDIFNIQLVEGRREDFAEEGDALISESTAARFFPDRDPIGEPFTYNVRTKGRIKGIYKDRKDNETLINGILIHEGETDWDLPNYNMHAGYYKLAPGADLAAVREAVGKVEFRSLKGFRLTQIHDSWFEKERAERKYHTRGDASLSIILLAIAVLFLAIAAFNYINFAIASVPLRIRDINTRKVFGASRRSLILRQVLQAALIIVPAFLLGILAMHWLSGTEWATFLSNNMEPARNGAVLWFGGAAALLIILVSSLIPALYSTSFQPALVLKSSFALSEKGGSLRTVTIGLQYVLSFIFILSALMLHRQTSFMVHNNQLGFDHERVLKVESHLYMKVKDVAEAFRDIPGVEAVTRGGAPMQLGFSSSEIRGESEKIVRYQFDQLPPEYFDFFGLQLADGRLPFPGEENVALVNEAFVNALPEYGVGSDLHSIYQGNRPVPVIGILKNYNARTLEFDYEPMAYFVMDNLNYASFMMRISPQADAAAVLDRAKTIYHEMRPMIDLQEIETDYLDKDIERLYERQTRQTRLIILSSLLSLLITLIGILGLVWLDALFMRKEIALRKVNGATVRDILSKINLRYLIIAAVSFVIAAPIAIAICRRWLEHFAFRTNMPAWLFVAAFVAVVLITLATVTLQCLRAANANPVDSLKNE